MLNQQEDRMIAEALKRCLHSAAGERTVADVRIGLGYTAVMLDDGQMGVAYTSRGRPGGGCSSFDGPRPIAGRSAAEILEYLGSSDGVQCSLGLAAGNALSNRTASTHQQGDILDLLASSPEDRVAMIGYFGPLVKPLQSRVRELRIFERDAGRSAGMLPAEQAYESLAHCDVAIITSASLVTGELDGLLQAARGCREVAMVGPSTPLVPEVLAPLGVTLLSGLVVIDGPGLLQVVSEGGGTRYFGKRVRKVNIRL